MNVYAKLSKARIKLQSTSIKQSGYNSGLKFKYMELEDFLPHINSINDELGIIAVFSIDDSKARLTIINTEKPEESIEFSSHTAQAKLQGAANPVQELGSQHTYLRRYLYLMGYEISEHDTLDPALEKEKPNTTGSPKSAYDHPTPPVYITEQQAATVAEKCAEHGLKIPQIYKTYNIDSLDKMTDANFTDFEKKIKAMK